MAVTSAGGQPNMPRMPAFGCRRCCISSVWSDDDADLGHCALIAMQQKIEAMIAEARAEHGNTQRACDRKPGSSTASNGCKVLPDCQTAISWPRFLDQPQWQRCNGKSRRRSRMPAPRWCRRIVARRMYIASMTVGEPASGTLVTRPIDGKGGATARTGWKASLSCLTPLSWPRFWINRSAAKYQRDAISHILQSRPGKSPGRLYFTSADSSRDRRRPA
jgi:hypothetical protein